MDEARKHAANLPFGAVMADSQSAGRGRLPGRTWHAGTGQALLATAWFPRSAVRAPIEPGQPVIQPPIALMAGLAVTKACLAWAETESSPFRQGIAIKWPNDLLCGSGKIAGILCEATDTSIYVGMGINCSQKDFPGEYRTKPTSILMETGRVPERNRLLALIFGELQSLLNRQSQWLPELDQFLAWKGKLVEFRQGLALGEPLRGILLGLAEDGGLVLQSGGSSYCFHSGELSPVIDEGFQS